MTTTTSAAWNVPSYKGPFWTRFVTWFNSQKTSTWADDAVGWRTNDLKLGVAFHAVGSMHVWAGDISKDEAAKIKKELEYQGAVFEVK